MAQTRCASSAAIRSASTPSTVAVGARVAVTGIQGSGIGTIRFIGVLSTGRERIGVELDEATGDCNGTLKGRSYFTCPPQHGVFVQRAKVDLIV